MPIYPYVCSACGEEREVLAKMSDPPPAACKACGAEGTMAKAVARSSFKLKGGGWYAQGYNTAGSASASKDSAPSSPAPSSPAPSKPGPSSSSSD